MEVNVIWPASNCNVAEIEPISKQKITGSNNYYKDEVSSLLHSEGIFYMPITSVLSEHDDYKVCYSGNISIYVRDLKTLIGSSWLNDKVKQNGATQIITATCMVPQIVDFYLSLLAEETNKKGQHEVLCLSSFFFTKLQACGKSEASPWVTVNHFL